MDLNRSPSLCLPRFVSPNLFTLCVDFDDIAEGCLKQPVSVAQMLHIMNVSNPNRPLDFIVRTDHRRKLLLIICGKNTSRLTRLLRSRITN